MSRTPALLVALLLGTAAAAVAQTPAEGIARQDEELSRLTASGDSLARLWREARALANLQDSLSHAASVGRLDTIAVGSLRIITNPSPLRLREAAVRYWPVVDSLFGDDARQLELYPARFQAVNPDTSRPGSGRWAMLVPWNTSEDDLVALLRSTVEIGQIDSALRSWIGRPIQPPLFGLPREASDAYIAVVASPYVVGRNCFVGDIAACRAALRLDDGNDTLLLAAYAPGAERHDVVLRLETFFRQQRSLEGFMNCRAGGDRACMDLLGTVPAAQLPQPLEREARLLLVHLALRQGGPQAYHRLMQSPELPLSQRVALAAGVPLDSLLDTWRSTLIAARPAPVTVPLSDALVGMAWVTLFGLCGLRSSRWRLG